ncbi:hypothetical protein GGR55DRAFT_279735 [Xylaria sp. FL0064]|nr:hypothetical protein GGR55DRAFT_279735 [Xylaria sp. FL0064]
MLRQFINPPFLEAASTLLISLSLQHTPTHRPGTSTGLHCTEWPRIIVAAWKLGKGRTILEWYSLRPSANTSSFWTGGLPHVIANHVYKRQLTRDPSRQTGLPAEQDKDGGANAPETGPGCPILACFMTRTEGRFQSSVEMRKLPARFLASFISWRSSHIAQGLGG